MTAFEASCRNTNHVFRQCQCSCKIWVIAKCTFKIVVSTVYNSQFIIKDDFRNLCSCKSPLTYFPYIWRQDKLTLKITIIKCLITYLCHTIVELYMIESSIFKTEIMYLCHAAWNG